MRDFRGRHAAFALSVILTAASLAAAGARPAAAWSAEQQADEKADKGEEVIAVVGGTPLYYKDLAGQLAQMEAFYRSGAANLPEETIREQLNAQADLLVAALVEEEILRQKLSEYGISLTEEEKKAVQSDDPALQERMLRAAELDKLKETILSEAEALPEEALKASYDALLAEQKESFSSDLTAFESAMIAGDPVAFVPETYRVLTEVSLGFDPDIQVYLAQLRQIDTEDDDSYEELLEQEYTRLEKLAADLKKRTDAGESPQEAAKAVAPESRVRTNYITERSNRFKPDYYEAAMSIAREGEAADAVIRRDDSVTVLYWDSTLPGGEIPYEELKEALASEALKAEEDGIWKETVEKWREETPVELHKEVYRYE